MRQALHTMCDALVLMGPSGHTQRSVGGPPALHTHGLEDPWPGTQRCSKASMRLAARKRCRQDLGKRGTAQTTTWLKWSRQEADDVGTTQVPKRHKPRGDGATRYQMVTPRGDDVRTTDASTATTVFNACQLRDVRSSSQNYRRRRKLIVVNYAKGKPNQMVARF